MRITVCFDLDCFYAQVAELHDKSLKGKPVLIKQKYVAVTCNYEARKYGIKKLETITKAKELCPHIIIVDGSDLSQFREASKKINDFWLEKLTEVGCTGLQRIGFDESFIDFTEVVQQRLDENCNKTTEYIGSVIGNENDLELKKYFAKASEIADEWRKDLYKVLGYTCCAGIGQGKIASKFAVDINKPNGQAIILPNVLEKYLEEKPIRSIQGIGGKLNHSIFNLYSEINTIIDMKPKDLTCGKVRQLSLNLLASKLKNIKKAQFVFNAVRGIDLEVIKNSDMILKTISIDDTSLPHPETTEECLPKLNIILPKLVKLLQERLKLNEQVPLTLKVTITNKKTNGEKNPQKHRGNYNFGWKVHTKQTQLNYSVKEVNEFRNKTFSLNIIKKQAKQLLNQIVLSYYTNIGRLLIARINVGVTNFVKVKSLNNYKNNSILNSFAQSTTIVKRKIEKVIKVDYNDVIDLIEEESILDIPNGVDIEVFKQLPLVIQNEIKEKEIQNRKPIKKLKTKRKTLHEYLKQK